MNEARSDRRPDASVPGACAAAQALRDLVAETRVRAEQLIMPHFVLPADRGVEPIDSMPGIARQGVEDLVRTVEADRSSASARCCCSGCLTRARRTRRAATRTIPDGSVPRAVRALKRAIGSDLVVVTDVCVCAYTDHGHCGVVVDGEVDNDASLRTLAAMALAHADAGADVVAPSDMMDGRVAAIRDALDARGHTDVAILSYAVKYASAYYGPFREAADSAPQHGDRRGYQMDSAQRRRGGARGDGWTRPRARTC